jgi:peptidyl-prolyl cis-trans isomerase B (cyclophilin B)
VASTRQQREQREARERLQRYQARQGVHAHQNRRRVRDNIIAVAGVVLVAGLATATQIFYFSAGPGAPTAAPSASPSDAPTGTNVGAPDPATSEYRTWTGTMVLNGDITLGIELDGAAAPQATAGFVRDAQDGYFEDKTCHRLASSDGFAFLQCGSLDGTGASDSGYRFGPIENAPADNVYPTGTIAMARGGNDAYSNGHQFFIVTDTTTLGADSAGGYTVVGRVTSGLENLIQDVTSQGIDPATLGQDGTGAPLVPTTITSVTVQ